MNLKDCLELRAECWALPTADHGCLDESSEVVFSETEATEGFIYIGDKQYMDEFFNYTYAGIPEDDAIAAYIREVNEVELGVSYP